MSRILVVEPLRAKLDPGSKTSGIAVVRDQTGEVVWAAELTHRSEQIREALSKRRILRRARRSRHTRYRAPRYANRRRPVGWLAPSLLSHVVHLLTWVKCLRQWCPIGAISQELVRFDPQALEHPEIQSIGYQRGTLFEAEAKECLLVKWKQRCAYCSAGETRLEIDHEHPCSRGGSNRVSNLVLACRSCNQAKAGQPVEVFLAERPDLLTRIQAQRHSPLADAAAVNATRWRLYEALQACGLPVEVGTGGRTRWNRARLGLPKTHWIDAAAVGVSTPARLRFQHARPWIIEATGRQTRHMVDMDACGFPRGRSKGPCRVQGFKAGDLVRAAVTKGTKIGTYQGRAVVKSDGYFKITGRLFEMVEGIHERYCRPLQRNDGYRYATGKAALPPSAIDRLGGSAALR